MFIESVLLHLGYQANQTLISEYFEMYSKFESYLFVFKSKKDGKRYCASASGEFIADQKDLVVFYFLTESATMYNESERLQIFQETHTKEIAEQKELKPIEQFNLYQILLKEASKSEDKVLVNSLETKEKHYFFFIDEEKIKSGRNILGVVSLDLKSRTEKILKFSELDRSIYFTNPSIKSEEAYIFNSFSEMIAFKKRQTKDVFYIVVKGTFNENHAKTISIILNSKGIKKTFLAFPGNLDGYASDLNYLSIFGNVKLKSRTASYKLNIPITSESDLLVDKIRLLKVTVEKDLENHNINTLIQLSKGKDHLGNNVFVVELPKISNVIMSFLVMASKFLFKDKEFKIIKPENVYWAKNSRSIKNAEKEYKLHLFNSVKEIYAYN